MMNLRTFPFRAALAFAAVLGCGHAAHADDEVRGLRVPLLPKYRQECASCHVAYPAGMLPADSWQRLLNNLPRHFGTDASLDPASVKELSAWLIANAGSYKRVREAPPQDRITTSAWFARTHGEVSAAAWSRPTIKSPANCSACHAQADQGDFNEHNVRIPR
jgi:mono/diheme cytochrome c family protein